MHTSRRIDVLPKKHAVLGLVGLGLGVLAANHLYELGLKPSGDGQARMVHSSVPSGFTVKDVRGDGNCFYYALAETLHETWNAQSVVGFKHQLLDWLDRNPDSDVAVAQIANEPGVRYRLSKNFEWAQQPEIQLAAEQLQRCIYVFKEHEHGQWTLSLSLPQKMRSDIEKRNRACLHDGRLVKNPLNDELYCSQCVERSSFLLNRASWVGDEGQHFVALIPDRSASTASPKM